MDRRGGDRRCTRRLNRWCGMSHSQSFSIRGPCRGCGFIGDLLNRRRGHKFEILSDMDGDLGRLAGSTTATALAYLLDQKDSEQGLSCMASGAKNRLQNESGLKAAAGRE